MGRASKAFEGIFTLNQKLVGQLRTYLDFKESQTSRGLIQAVEKVFPSHGMPPQLEPSFSMKLIDGVEAVEKRARSLRQSGQMPSGQGLKVLAQQFNELLWNFLETIKISADELFQQLAQTHIEEWHMELAHVAKEVKELLEECLNDLKCAFRRLQSELKELKLCLNSKQRWKNLFTWRSTALDRNLFSQMDKCQKYMDFAYQRFADSYSRYVDMRVKIELAFHRWEQHHVFDSLDSDTQEKIKQVFYFVRAWEMNRSSRAMPQREITLALRHLMSAEKAFQYFKEYEYKLKATLFEMAWQVKGKKKFAEKTIETQISTEAQHCKEEVQLLRGLIQRYRNFLLRTDPNPYVRSRIGFPEWVAGPEPALAKKLRSLDYDLEDLYSQFDVFKNRQEQLNKPLEKMVGEAKVLLHEMNQPLRSKEMMRTQANHLIKVLDEMDEMGSSDREVVDHVGHILSKAMQADWRYQVLFDAPKFHKLMAIHLGVVGPTNDRQHLGRIYKFKKIIKQIEQWLKKYDTPKHTHEIELEINDIKESLQDFLASVQRLKKMEGEAPPEAYANTKKVVQKIEEQLVEYRYLFGGFFHHLREEDPEERMLRRQFLFVDQYFEAIESCLSG